MGLTQIINNLKQQYITFKEDFFCPVDIYQIEHPQTQELHYFVVGGGDYGLGKDLNRSVWGTPLHKLISKELGFSLKNSTYKKIPLSQAKERDLPMLESSIRTAADGWLRTYDVVLTKEQSDREFWARVKTLPAGDWS